MSVNDYRRCAKCGKTRAEDMTVTYHRFPNPGKDNNTKAHAWAKYCWPNDDWSSRESLYSLHITNKVLCGRHFHSSQFYDSTRKKLSKFAVPELTDLLNDKTNVFNQNATPSTVAGLQKSRVQFSQIENIPVAPIKVKPTNILSPLKRPADPIQPSKSSDKEQNAAPSTVAGLKKSRVPFSQIENIPVAPILVKPTNILSPLKQPTDSIQPSKSTDKEQNAPKEILPSESTSTKNVQSQVLPYHDESHLTKSASKKCNSILSAINVSKVSELTSREVNLYNICKKKLREIIRLRKKYKNKKTDIVKAISEDENVQQLCDLNISNSFVVLLQSQLKNCPKKPKGRRYTLNQKIMALVIYKKSPACYRLLRRMFTLPCQSSLNKLLNRVPLKPGINRHIFTSLKKMTAKQTDEEKICILSFDEISIRKHLYYDSKSDEIQGFKDHGHHGRSNEIATKALVFMLAGVRKKWKQPIAFYFSHTLTADRMTVILKEILTECINCNVNVVATVCDLSTVNLKVLKTLGVTTREPFFLHCEKEIVAILDPPHLLKCTRNLLMKHDVECTTDVQCNDKTVKGTAKWSHIEIFYLLDKSNANFVFAPALTDHHLHPNVKQQMRVKLAAQVFSHSVTAGILAKIASNELPTEAHATATFIQNFDKLFDAVNADSPDLRRGKKYSTNLTARSPHIALFGEMRKFISSMKYLGSKSNPPSQEGWIHTMNAIERLWKNLQAINIKSLSTRRLNQDPLENCFGCIRYNCGSNNNPTIQQFVAGVKTAIITNLRHSGQKKNCEDDSAILSNNLSSFLTADLPNNNFETAEFDSNEMETLLADAVETVEQVTPESQACGYVCGFIFKKLRHNDCPNCRNAFLAETHETIHTFTSFKEYDTTNNSLSYVNKNVVLCVETMATIINNYLKRDAWKSQIKQNIIAALECVDFSSLNKCMNHFESNINHLKTSTFYICTKRYVILKNRELEEDEKRKAMERKMGILKNK